MNLVFKDKAGKELSVGDYVVYGQALGRCASLNYAIVTGIQESKGAWSEGKVKLRVRALGHSYRSKQPVLMEKDVFLEFDSRVLRISMSQMPEEVYKLLSEYHQQEIMNLDGKSTRKK